MKKIIISLILISLFVTSEAKTRKTIYVVVDGIPADYIERVHPKTIFDIASKGNYARAFTGGEVGAYSQTPTISAIGYMNILTGTWLNKHNVNGNSNLKPNYNYWSIFRIAKEQKKDYKTALFSSWVDNRKVLIGTGKPETNNLKIDYVYDGYDLDSTRFAPKPHHLQIFDIDSVVAMKAADCVRSEAPDLSWVYLWYTDSGFHLFGDGSFMDKYVNKTDELIKPIWDAVRYREKNFDEEWMVIITTDHGRDESGPHHGGQAQRERSCWISTNIKGVNPHFQTSNLALTDINPSICEFMGFELPEKISFEQDGVPFVGKIDIDNLRTAPYANNVTLEWDSYSSREKAEIYVATTNNFREGGEDDWIKLAEVPAKSNRYMVDLNRIPSSKFYKFIVKTSNNSIGRWLKK